MCLPSLIAPQVNLSITYESGVEFQMKTWNNLQSGFLSRTTQILMISRCYFANDGLEIHTVLKRTCWAIVLLIRSFVLPRTRCRRRRGLLKVPSEDLLEVYYENNFYWSVSISMQKNSPLTSFSLFHICSRVFIKILFQELAEYLGLPKLNERLKDP